MPNSFFASAALITSAGRFSPVIGTSLSKRTQGIDADALQNQSATAVAQVFSGSQMRIKLIARIMAEGVRDIFALLHGTIRKHGKQLETVRLRNAWIEVDPRNWKTCDDMNMTINVGLGSGGKLLIWDKVLGLGTTDPLAGFASITSKLVVSFSLSNPDLKTLRELSSDERRA